MMRSRGSRYCLVMWFVNVPGVKRPVILNIKRGGGVSGLEQLVKGEWLTTQSSTKWCVRSRQQ